MKKYNEFINENQNNQEKIYNSFPETINSPLDNSLVLYKKSYTDNPDEELGIVQGADAYDIYIVEYSNKETNDRIYISYSNKIYN